MKSDFKFAVRSQFQHTRQQEIRGNLFYRVRRHSCIKAVFSSVGVLQFQQSGNLPNAGSSISGYFFGYVCLEQWKGKRLRMEDGFGNGGICREGASRPKEADAKRQTGIKITKGQEYSGRHASPDSHSSHSYFTDSVLTPQLKRQAPFPSMPYISRTGFFHMRKALSCRRYGKSNPSQNWFLKGICL